MRPGNGQDVWILQKAREKTVLDILKLLKTNMKERIITIIKHLLDA